MSTQRVFDCEDWSREILQFLVPNKQFTLYVMHICHDCYVFFPPNPKKKYDTIHNAIAFGRMPHTNFGWLAMSKQIIIDSCSKHWSELGTYYPSELHQWMLKWFNNHRCLPGEYFEKTGKHEKSAKSIEIALHNYDVY